MQYYMKLTRFGCAALLAMGCSSSSEKGTSSNGGTSGTGAGSSLGGSGLSSGGSATSGSGGSGASAGGFGGTGGAGGSAGQGGVNAVGGSAGSGGATGSGGAAGAGASLSSRYPCDLGIENDPAVVFTETFEEPTINDMLTRWEDYKYPERMAFTADLPAASAGTQSLLFNGVSDMYRRLLPGFEQLYFRFYVKFDPACTQIHHFHGLGGHNPSTSYPWPRAGTRPVGDERWSSWIEPYGASWSWDFYTYWMHMRSNPDTMFWGNDFTNGIRPAVRKGEWIAVELMVKMNNPVTSYNGEQAFWIDGQLANHLALGSPRGTWTWDSFTPDSSCTPSAPCDQNGSATTCCQDFEGMQWRTALELNINYLWLENYVDTDPTCKSWIDDVVVAKEYIGPISAPTACR